MVQLFEIDIQSLSYGTENIVLVFDSQKIPFSASYIGLEPLSSLIESLIGLEEEIINMDHTRYFITWQDEPGWLKFEMYKDNVSDHLTIKILFDNCGEGLYHKRGEWEFAMTYSLYKETVIKAALNALNKYGLNGFNDSWADGKDIFPLCSLISLLGAKSDFDKEGGYFHSNIFGELQLLSKALQK